MQPTANQQACFELGIKFGSLYHQFAGTPVSPSSAPSLVRAMEEAIENQPYCTSVNVRIRTDVLEADLDEGYTELSGRHLDTEITVEYDGIEASADIVMDGDYPRMRLLGVDD